MINKTGFLLIVLLVVYTNGQAQPDIKNNTSVRSDSNIIYKGVENFLQLSGLADYHFVRLKSSRLLFTATKDPEVFSVKAQSRGTDTLYLMHKGKTVFSKKFEIVSVPPVTAILGVITDSVTTVTQIILNPVLRAIRQNCNCSVGHVIGGFHITFIGRHLGNIENSFFVTGSRFDDLVNIIKRLQPDDKMVFDNIRTIDIDSYPLKLQGFAITIK